MPRGPARLRTQEGLKNQIGSRVKSRRIDLGFSQDQLCAKVAHITGGVWNPDFQELYRLESGKRIVTTLELPVLSEALDIDVLWLLQGDSQQPTERTGESE
jgi:transcriptional regulator with XRE-family HTH domain